MAAALFAHLADGTPAHRQAVADSAGTRASAGQRAAEHARAVMSRRGIPLGHHRSKRIDPELIATAGLVLVMEPGHQQELLQLYPDADDKISVLGAYAGTDEPVPDPIGGNRAVYESCAERLERLVHLVIQRLAEKG
jgi:protein-tyrosine-phosphatase